MVSDATIYPKTYSCEGVVHYCTLSMTECRVGTPYMRRNFIDGPPKASVDQSGPSFLQKLHLECVPGPQKKFGDHSTFFLAPKWAVFGGHHRFVENVGRALKMWAEQHL